MNVSLSKLAGEVHPCVLPRSQFDRMGLTCLLTVLILLGPATVLVVCVPFCLKFP